MANIHEDILRFKFKKLHPDAQSPQKNSGDVGWDLFCVADENFREVYLPKLNGEKPEKCLELTPGSRYTFDIGIALELPLGYHAVIEPRSGLATKQGIDVLAGIIDGSFRGSLKVCLHNTSGKTVSVCGGDKIAQMIIIKENDGYFVEVEELDETDRGEKGFGSSGK